VRLKVNMKSDNCGENAECSGKGVCYSDPQMVISQNKHNFYLLSNEFSKCIFLFRVVLYHHRMCMNVIVVTVSPDIIAKRLISAHQLLAKMAEYVWTSLKGMMEIRTNAYVLMVSLSLCCCVPKNREQFQFFKNLQRKEIERENVIKFHVKCISHMSGGEFFSVCIMMMWRYARKEMLSFNLSLVII
jgi:hypothetical protein